MLCVAEWNIQRRNLYVAVYNRINLQRYNKCISLFTFISWMGGNIFGVLYSSVPRPCMSAYISKMEWRCHLRYWRMEQNVFFFDDRILNSIDILRHSGSSPLKCSFVTTHGPPGDTRSFSVLTWVVYSLPRMFFFFLLFTTWFTPTTSSNAVTLSLYIWCLCDRASLI